MRKVSVCTALSAATFLYVCVCAAAATMLLLLPQGLYTVDFSGAAPIITAAAALTKDGTAPKQYNDIRWASGSGRLYAAAGDAVSIDVLEVQQM